jgi:hypothetical protein
MATQQTTLVGAITNRDIYAQFAIAPPYPPNSYALIDGELCAIVAQPVSTVLSLLRRGLDGGVVAAHPAGAPVTIMQGGDLPALLPATDTSYPPAPARSFTASGAIDPNPGIVTLNGNGALAMTLAAPSPSLQGQQLFISATGKAAHTVAVGGTNGIGGKTITFPAYQTTVILIPISGGWTIGSAAGATIA